MIKSLLGRLQPQPERGATANTHNPLPSDRDESEEDGFLLVGETASDRSTVTHQQFVAQQGAHPHNPHIGVDQPPNYQAVTGQGMTAMNTTGLSPLGMDPVPSNNNHMYPISDIPFQLAPQLTVLQRLCSFSAEFGQHRTSFDWSKYDYDFQFERNYLKEHGMEHTLGTAVREERDLIQF